MSEDFILALVLCAIGSAAVLVAAIFAFRQKVYYDPNENQITEIEVPILGKLKTNTPAIALCFLGVVLGYLAYDLMKGRGPKLVKFQGEIAIDQSSVSGIDAVMVGVTSGSWLNTATPNGPNSSFPVEITVPNSWPSYSAYAFALGESRTRPAMIGANLEDHKFKLSIRP
jgi:hypothetical protein